MRRLISIATVAALALAGGCVERTITIVTQPGEAQFTLDTDNVGLTTGPDNDIDPKCAVPFDFYGTRTFVISKSGYETLVIRKPILPPIYEMPVVSFFAENLIPLTLHDDHYYEFRLTPRQPVSETELMERAGALGKRVQSLPGK